MRFNYFTILLVTACMCLGTAVAFASPSARKHHSKNPVGFAVLTKRGTAKIASMQGNAAVPAGAVLASNAGGNNVYVFERLKGLESETCVADVLADMTAAACGTTEVAEHDGIVLLLPNRNDGTAVVLVSNDVKSIAFSKAGGSEAATVTNNVAVAEGAFTAYHFETPTGDARTIPLER